MGKYGWKISFQSSSSFSRIFLAICAAVKQVDRMGGTESRHRIGVLNFSLSLTASRVLHCERAPWPRLVFEARVSSNTSEPAVNTADGRGVHFQCAAHVLNGFHRIHRIRWLKGAVTTCWPPIKDGKFWSAHKVGSMFSRQLNKKYIGRGDRRVLWRNAK